ncbi:MAG TPA: hypothetical protein VHB79_38285 [Polyangiaceae bacterium]|nr:hypothetical protein [Polyangiaceae bacterium]
MPPRPDTTETAPAPTPAAPPPATPAPATPAPAPATTSTAESDAVDLSEEPEKLPAPLVTPARRFGDQGGLVFSDLLSASLGVGGYTKSEASSASFGIDPAFDYFVARDVIIGGSAFVHYSSSTSGLGVKSYGPSVGISFHLGRNVPISDLFSVRPVLSLGAWQSSITLESPGPNFAASAGGTVVPGTSNVKESVVVVGLYSPVLLHLAEHFFVGFGPDAYFDPYHSTTSEAGTSEHLRYHVGASSIVGGWF